MASLAAIVGITGAAVGLLLAAFSLGMARSPFWAERRQFALVAATAAGYCLFDVALVLDLPGETIAFAVQVALAFGVAQCIAWIRYLALADQRELRPMERRFVLIGCGVAAAGFVPGLLLTRDLFTFTVSWLGITYRTPQPTLIGLALYVYLCAALLVVAAGARHRWREGWQARLPILGVVTLGAFAVNDTLASAGIIEMPLLLDISSISIVLIVGLMHERRFAANMHQLERASVELRREVAARTSALLQAQAALAASERLAGLGRLTAGVAHEINNPIAVVQHSLERIRESRSLSAGGDERYIENGLAATDRVVRIVRRLLDAGRVASAEAANVEPFLIAPVARKALEMVGRHLSEAQVSVEVADDLTALGDRGLVSQVIENLLVNAAQALEQRPNARIVLRAARVEDLVHVSVADNGPGVPEHVRARLFEPFVTTKAVGKGSGLGLAVSKGLMRSQHGDLILERTSAFGTEMRLSLPSTPLAPAVHAEPIPPVVALHGMRMLIIDDEADVREMLVDVCAMEFDVMAAGSIADGLTTITRGRRPDIVLCDLMMPDGGADEWLKLCGEKFPELADRTVIITGGPATARDEALVAANADRVVYKPFSIAQLRTAIARVAPRPLA